MWAMDNWLYSTINLVRLRWTPNGVLREPTGSSGGQWSVTQDNYGKPWFQAGRERHAWLFPDAGRLRQLRESRSVRTGPEHHLGRAGAHRRHAGRHGLGPHAGRLAHARDRLAPATTSSAAIGCRPTCVGDYFYGEVVARIVRRLRPVKNEGLTQLRNVYPLSEFIRSTDPLFRPVDMTTAPDGTMYITDMYRGIIQESQWSGPGTYLRQRINQYALDKVVRHGRIWRLSYDGHAAAHRLSRAWASETAAQLVAHLSDPNGWWRDTAQQLLVLKQDKSVVPALIADGAAHAPISWRASTRCGRSKDSAALDATLRAAADEGRGRADAPAGDSCERDALQGRRQVVRPPIGRRLADRLAMPDVVMQAMMTMRTLKVADANAWSSRCSTPTRRSGPQLVASTILAPPRAGRGRGNVLEAVAAYSPEEQAVNRQGRDDLQRALLCVPRRGRARRAESGRRPAPRLRRSRRRRACSVITTT